MKKQFLIAIGLFFAISIQAQQDPILMQINGKPVTKSDFLQIYLKNNQQPKYDKVSLDEYMELFKKFKLKVTEAEALGYDTLPKLKKELDGYKKQLALPYLIDAGKNQEFVKEAYDRTKNEIRASHILIRIEPTASPADTLIAYNKIMALKARIDKGEDFAAVAKGRNGSEDPSAQTNGGDLGFFNAFQMVYPFEDQAYKTEIGKVSMPFRTRFGYHIVKVTDTRTTRGTIKTAHIMVSIPKTATQEEIATGEKKIYEIYTKLMNGEKFEDLAKNFSDDPSSNQKGGELTAFGTGTTTRMVPSFEDAAYALQKDGDISQPIRTEYGFHIIKRLELKPLKSFEELKKELQNKVNKDERSKKTQDFFVEKLKTTYNFVDVSKKSKKWFVSNLDTTYFIGKWHPTNLKTEKPLFMLDGKTYTQKDFASYLESNYKGIKKDAAKNIVELQFKNWVKATILSYEESKLTTKYPEYKALVNEYHDGILLYEIMSDKVWNKASRDTVGLKAYFSTNRTNYMWKKRLDATIYECATQKIADQVAKMLKNDTINSKHVLDVVNKESELNLRVRMNKFEIEDTPYLKEQKLAKGLNKSYSFDGKFYVVKVESILEPAPKELKDAKGVITSDYQNYLEKNWLEELTKKYPIEINASILYNLGN